MKNDHKENQVRKLKDLEVEIKELIIDALLIEKKVAGRLLRVKELEGETDKAKGNVVDLYANLRVLNSRIVLKMQEIKSTIYVFTGEYDTVYYHLIVRFPHHTHLQKQQKRKKPQGKGNN